MSDVTYLYRYMDFAGFMSLLEESAIYLAPADILSDPWEGYVVSASSFPITVRTKDDEEVAADAIQLKRITKDLKGTMGVSCWHVSTSENALMWLAYGKSDQSVAIKCLASDLARQDDLGLRQRSVSYVDSGARIEKVVEAWQLLTYKRAEFTSEKEFRFIDARGASLRPQSGRYTGTRWKIDLDRTLREIIVSPRADLWFGELIRKIAVKYGVNCPVKFSTLKMYRE